MKSGYDQFFKKAQKIAAQSEAQPRVSRRPQGNDAKILAEQLRSRVRPKPAKKTKRPVPWKLVGFSLIGLLLATMGLLQMDKIEKVIRSVEVSMLGSAYAADTNAESKTESKAQADKAAVKVDGKKEAAAESTVDKKDFTPEEINHFSKLNERKRELDAREEELNRMEQELALQKTDLEKRLVELESNRRNISSVLQEKVQVDDKKVENLVQMYSNMKPQHAAKAFEDMDEGLAIEILGRMKKKNAAEIMNLVKSEKVKILSEKYAGYKRN